MISKDPGDCVNSPVAWPILDERTDVSNTSAPRTCDTNGCGRPHFARSMCRNCYMRAFRAGLPPIPRPTAEQRFWAKVAEAPAEDCWIWTASKARGYGRFYFEGIPIPAYRFAYQFLIAEIPAGLHLDHLCRNPACVNPWHLDPVTPAVNVQRGMAGILGIGPTCPKGHELTPENTYREGATQRCRTCSRIKSRAAYAARRAARLTDEAGAA